MNNPAFELLWRIYGLVKSWLEYAEKKNAILFTIVGLEMGALNFLETQLDSKYLAITLIILAIAFIVALVSFCPKTDRLLFLEKTHPPEDLGGVNLLFYGDITKFSIDSYINALEKHYSIEVRGNSLAKDLSDQIVILSQIASSKFTMFKVALFFAILGQLSLFLSIALGKLSLA
jgi:hypothetical protein